MIETYRENGERHADQETRRESERDRFREAHRGGDRVKQRDNIKSWVEAQTRTVGSVRKVHSEAFTALVVCL